MSRVAWVTDPHLDHASPEALETFQGELLEARVTGVIVTGDIAESIGLQRYLDWFREHCRGDLWFCLGNHDFYYDSIDRVRATAAAWARETASYYLNIAEPMEMAPGVGLVGHDGWADGRTPSYERSLVFMHDSRLIADFAGQDKLTRWETMKRLADESANWIEQQIVRAAERWRTIYVATHVPPYREACWYNGEISDDHWAPHFTNVAFGERLIELADRFPQHRFHVLCGHTHGGGSFSPQANLTVETGAAEYGSPRVTRILEW